MELDADAYHIGSDGFQRDVQLVGHLLVNYWEGSQLLIGAAQVIGRIVDCGFATFRRRARGCGSLTASPLGHVEPD